MRQAFVTAAALLSFSTGALLAPALPQARAEERVVVATVEEARAVDPALEAVTVRMGGADVLAALVERAPKIRDLHFSNPSNKVDPKALPLLVRLPELRTLKLTGDMFLYDAEFAALGKLSKLTTLNMHLP